MYGLYLRPFAAGIALMHRITQGQFHPRDHVQHAPLIAALFVAEEHSGELRRRSSP
jgi:hypothetical protein